MNVFLNEKSDPDLNCGSKRGCHGNSDCHRLVVKGCVVKNSKWDEKEDERSVDSIQERQGKHQRAGELVSLSRLVQLRQFQAAFCACILRHTEAGLIFMTEIFTNNIKIKTSISPVQRPPHT